MPSVLAFKFEPITKGTSALHPKSEEQEAGKV